MKTRTLTYLAALAVSLMTAHSPAWADDTEVFFNALDTQTQKNAPNILFILDTGATMNENLGGDSSKPTRLWIMKDALITVLQGLVNDGTKVNVGIMRMAVNGQADVNSAAKGGFLARPVQPLTQAVVDDWKRLLCLNNKDKATPVETTGCDLIQSNKGTFPVFATPQQTGAGSAASPITEMLSEAYLYFSGKTPQWGQNALIGPNLPFPSAVISGKGCSSIDKCTILPEAALVPADCSGSSGRCKYKSPAQSSCVNNYIVILSNGVFSVDTGNDGNASASGSIAGWPTFNAYTGENTTSTGTASCSNNPYTDDYKAVLPQPKSDKLSVCPDDAVNTMRTSNFDVAGVPGVTKASVTTYAIGFDVNSSIKCQSTKDCKTSDLPNATKAAYKHLETIATAGGTSLVLANDSVSLVDAFKGIIQDVVIDNASFNSPSVAVNAFNQLQNLNDLYFAVFSPTPNARWTGNVKKYRIDPNTGDIRDVNNKSAVVNGFFSGSSQSFWSIARNAKSMPDGAASGAGGAASRLPDVKTSITARKVYTNISGSTGTLSPLSNLNTATTVTNKSGASVTVGQFLGTSTCTPVKTTTFSPAPADSLCPEVGELIDWAYGRDVACQVLPNNIGDPIPKKDAAGNVIKDTSGNPVILYPTACDKTMTRWDMGDLLHGKPAVVTYSVNTTTKALTQYLFGVTNDGYLHAIDVNTGEEKWAYLPWDLVDRLFTIYKNEKEYPRSSLGLDSPVKVLRIDAGNDNIIDPSTRDSGNLNDLSKGDHVYLYFGMRRGGRNYYAVDVTDINNPRLVWRISPAGTDSVVSGVTKSASDFQYLGQTWSSPQITRIAVPTRTDATNNPNHWVLVFGGGYDPVEDHLSSPSTPQGYMANTVGNGIYIVNAASGKLLWRAGKDAGADLQLNTSCPSSGSSSSACMNNAIPGDVRVIELTAPVSADLLYAADLGGRIWRFKINKSATTLTDFIQGGVLAYLGGSSSDANGTVAANARRFFAAPDVSWITMPNGTLSLNIAIGSGNREMPISDDVTIDRFYSIREPYPINWSKPAITDSALYDLRTSPTDSSSLTYPGWKLTLYQSGDVQNGAGAKVISEARTFQNIIFFTSFVPIENPLYKDADECTTQLGINNLYQVDVYSGNGKVYNPRNLPTTADSRAVTLNQGGISPEVQFIFPSSPTDKDGNPIGPPPKPVCLAGAESCGQFNSYEPTRTYWRQDKTD